MKALPFPWFVEKVSPLCTRGSLKAVEAGETWQGFNGSPSVGRIRIMVEVSEEFFPFCLPRVSHKLAD